MDQNQILCTLHNKPIKFVSLETKCPENERTLCEECQISKSNEEEIVSVGKLLEMGSRLSEQYKNCQVKIKQKIDEYLSRITKIKDCLDTLASTFQMDINEINSQLIDCEQLLKVQKELKYYQQLGQFLSTKMDVTDQYGFKILDIQNIDNHLQKLQMIIQCIQGDNYDISNKQIEQQYILQKKIEIQFGPIQVDTVDRPMAINRDSNLLGNVVNGINNVIQLYQLNNEKWILQEELKDLKHDIYSIQIGDNIIVAGGKSELIVWQRDEENTPYKTQQLWKLEEENNFILCIGLNQTDNLIATGWKNGFIVIYKKNEEGNWFEMQRKKKHTKLVESVAINYNSSILVTGGLDKLILIWIQIDGLFQMIQKLTNHQNNINALSLSLISDLMVSGGNDQKIIFWKLNDKGQYSAIQQDLEQGKIDQIQLSSDDTRMISLSNMISVKIWMINNSKWIWIQEIRRDQWFVKFQSFVLSRDMKYLIIANSTHKLKSNYLSLYQLN